MTHEGSRDVEFDTNHLSKIAINLSLFNIEDCNAFDIKFTFSKKIAEFRDHDYTWRKCHTTYIANQFSPKIIRLKPMINPDFYMI